MPPKIDVVQLVRENKDRFEWAEVKSEHKGYTLFIQVFRDAMKFDNIPALTWDFKPVVGDSCIFDGVRLPATAYQLQQIADMLNCMLLTSKVTDLIWLQADIKFDAVINVLGKIVAVSHIQNVHNAIEEKIQACGGDDGKKLISCVGKYWILINSLYGYSKLYGFDRACNYGWFALKASGPGITPGTQCYQRPGFKHNNQHWDPSQTIRLMHRTARLICPDGTEKYVDLYDIAKDKILSYLISHTGPFTYLRQKGPDSLEPIVSEPLPGTCPIKKPEFKFEPKPKLEPELSKEENIQIIEKNILNPVPETSETVKSEVIKNKTIWDLILLIISLFLKLFKTS